MGEEAVTKEYTSNEGKSSFGSMATIKRLIGENKTVLDVGCASGYLGKLCDNSVFYGLDGNAEAIQIARKHYKSALTVDLNNLPTTKLFNNQFDVIVFADVLEHLLDPIAVLRHFRPYLKPGGRIIISLPNIALWRVRLNLLLGRFDYTDYGVLDRTHLHFYTFKTARELVDAAGLHSIETKGAANLFGPVVAFVPFLKRLLSIHIIVVAAAE